MCELTELCTAVIWKNNLCFCDLTLVFIKFCSGWEKAKKDPICILEIWNTSYIIYLLIRTRYDCGIAFLKKLFLISFKSSTICIIFHNYGSPGLQLFQFLSVSLSQVIGPCLLPFLQVFVLASIVLLICDFFLSDFLEKIFICDIFSGQFRFPAHNVSTWVGIK